jgi:hypothetical protein
MWAQDQWSQLTNKNRYSWLNFGGIRSKRIAILNKLKLYKDNFESAEKFRTEPDNDLSQDSFFQLFMDNFRL